MYCLQNRWKREGKRLVYYGLRNKPNMFKNRVKLSQKQLAIIGKLPCDLSETEIKTLGDLFGVQIVEEKDKRKTPASFSEARFCTSCVANDFMIPGLEFDEDGLCPMCQTKKETEKLRSVVPVMNEFPVATKSRFDVAVFYTGGKDSTYLLYYLSKVLNLRVLAMTWEIPYMSECARNSIDGAKKTLSSVEFITRKVSDDVLRKIYGRLYELNENTCACPSLAYVLFYPELVINRVPYFIAGNEPAQLIGLYYNHMAPKIAYSFSENRLLNFMINVGRVLTLRPPLKKGQLHTLETMKQLAYGDNRLKNLAGYYNELVANVSQAVRSVPEIVKPLKRAIKSSSRSGNIPAFVQVDLDVVAGGKYEWSKIKDIIIKECGWVAPSVNNKGLHTSCCIERCKEYTQFKRFYDMKSTMIPFSALEIALGSRDKNVPREQAMAELREQLGFSLEEIDECAIMKDYINK